MSLSHLNLGALTDPQFFSLMLAFDSETLTFAGIIIAVVLVFATVLGIVLAKLYRRASKELAFVRTGFGGQKVIMNGGALVFPILHDIIKVNMNTLRLEVGRANEQALITKDRMRVDVKAEFYVRVQPTEDSIANAAQTLGQRTMHPEALKELVEGKFVDALRSVAAEMGMEELHEQRASFVQKVQSASTEDLLKNGLELESVSLTALDQTDQQFFNPDNAFDAQGLTKLKQQIEARRKERNDIEQETSVQIQMKNLEAERKRLEMSREEEYAKLEQEREIAIRRAAQAAEIARERALKDQDSKQAEIAAKQQVDLSQIQSERAIQEERIQNERMVRQRDIEKNQALEAAEINKLKAIELAEQDRSIEIAEKSRSKSEAEADAAKARAEFVRADEQVATVKETEIAERKKQIELVQASQVAEREAIGIRVAAEVEKQSALDKAEALRTLAQAEAEKIRISAQGAAEAEKLRAEASKISYAVEAEGKRALNEASNVLSSEMILMEIKKAIIDKLPEIIRESVRPMEKIDGIKIVQVDGLRGAPMRGGSGSGSGDAGSGYPGGLSDQIVNSALQYRAHAPLLDSILKEVGIDNSNLAGMTKTLQFSTETKSPPTLEAADESTDSGEDSSSNSGSDVSSSSKAPTNETQTPPISIGPKSEAKENRRNK